ncbi:flagellar hook-basal body protein FliE, partial [Escherichia coli]|uniref:flagellar hook-basal body complex protein FliE n=1 Tax=Escherichia coli TaxID=562 RepID=UPI00132C5178|nr:flagellar hook-basal body protein FliE [Escherichia coli]
MNTINRTSQAQNLQPFLTTPANAQAPVRPAMTFSSTDPDVSFHRIMQGALGHVDQFQQVAEQQQTAIDMGKSDDLAGAM